MSFNFTLGLYFNDHFIEISGVSEDGLRLTRYNYLILPAGLVVNGEIKDAKAFQIVLKQLLATAQPGPIKKNEEVVVGINENKIYLREFSVPNLPGKNINDAIDYQVKLLSPVMPSEVVTDWQIIGKDADGQIEVLLAAIDKTLIESYVAVCNEVGLKVVAVEPAVFANIRIIIPSQILEKNQLLVHLNDNFGSFSLITGGNPRFSELLSQDEIDKNGGLVKTILTYINFANSKHPTRQVQEVLISGYSQEKDGAIVELNAQAIITVKATSRLESSSKDDQTTLHTSHGLAFKFANDTETLNLLPVEYRLNIVRARANSGMKVVLNLMIFFMILVTSGLFYLNDSISDRKSRLLLQKLQGEQTIDQNLVNRANELNLLTAKLVYFREITGGEEDILETMSSITAPGISLTSMQFTRNPGSKKLLDLKNPWIITGSAVSRDLVLRFYESLIARPEFAGGKLYFGSLEKETGLSFRIASQPTK